MPEEGVEKAPVAPNNPRVNPHLKEAGQRVRIDFTGKCNRYPYTLTAHALLEYAATVNNGRHQNDLQEEIFHAYFTEGLYPDATTLLPLAEKVGLDVSACKAAIENPNNIAAARNKALSWSQRGVTGVPFFVMNGQMTFSGAQEVQTFVHNFNKIAAQQKSATGSSDNH